MALPHSQTLPPSAGEQPILRAWVQALRLHQWLKNVLIFVPLITAHLFLDQTKVATAIVAFLCFSLCASSVYLLNDLLDIHNDRQHRTKCKRPFASGRLAQRHGWIAWPLLLLAAFALAVPLLPRAFLGALAAYYIITVSYSLYLKRKLMIDVIALAVLYTMRIIAGALAIEVALSFWLLTFSTFAFTSLALIKRYAELRDAREQGAGANLELRGRGLSVRDLDMVAALGVAAGCVAVLVLALYVQDPATRHLYAHPNRIWPACPILFYWFARIWMFAHRGWMNEDPVIYAARDRPSILAALLIAAIFSFAK